MNKRDYPIWETLAMVASFALLWAWIAARNLAKSHHAVLWPGWNLVQVAALLLLAIIFVRRMMRVRAAMKELDPRNRNQPRFDAKGHSSNGHNRK